MGGVAHINRSSRDCQKYEAALARRLDFASHCCSFVSGVQICTDILPIGQGAARSRREDNECLDLLNWVSGLAVFCAAHHLYRSTEEQEKGRFFDLFTKLRPNTEVRLEPSKCGCLSRSMRLTYSIGSWVRGPTVLPNRHGSANQVDSGVL